MQYRRALPSVLVLSVLAIASCDEFPEPLESDSGLISVDVVKVGWPSELVLGGSTTLEVEVLDRQDRTVLDVPLEWTLEQGSAGAIQQGADTLTADLDGTSLGWARVTVTVTDDERFDAQPLQDSVPILLSGVTILNPQADTTLTAVGDEVTLTARGLAQGGNTVAGTGLTWELVSGSSVSAVTSTSADEITVQASAEGESVIAATHTLCVSTSPCADTIRVTVDQLADSVALQSRADTLIAEDTVTLVAEAFDVNGNSAPNETFTWASRDASVATVNASGRVTAQGSGQTYVVVTSGTGADSAAIQVNGSGTITVDLTDAPADNLASAMLYLSGAYVIDNAVANGRRALLDTPFSVDLLTLADTVTPLGSAIRVPVGTYSNVWLDVDSAVITLRAGLTFADGTTRRSFVPDPDTVAAPIEGAATFADGDSVAVVLDFDVDGSFPMAEPSGGVVGEPTFDPTTRAVKRTQAASIAGTVGTAGAVSVADLPVRAVRTDLVSQDTIYTRTDAGGAYKFRYLAAGSYDLSMPRPPACHVPTPALQTVAPTAGQALVAVDFSVDSVTIDSVSATAVDTINAIGFTTTVSATAYQGATALAGLGIEYSSADPGIATVDAVSGQVTAVATGNARIVAAACGSTDTSVVTVRQVAASATILPQDTAIEAGDSVQYTAELLDSADVAIDGAVFEFSSLDTNIATIDLGPAATAWARALKSGSVTIEAVNPATGIFTSTVLNVLLAPSVDFALNRHAGCALTSTGQVACWGLNYAGVVGVSPTGTAADDTLAYPPQTIDLPPAETFVDVAVGWDHACAVSSLGDIYCWGSGSAGELGNGSSFDSHTPVLVQRPAAETFTGVTAGRRFTCATTASGQGYCWGSNDRGMLGNGTTTSTNIPTAISHATVFTEIVTEDRTVCALTDTGQAECWGDGNNGRLGNGNTADSFVPVGVNMPVSGFTQLAMSELTSCALGTDGIPYCWGWNNYIESGGPGEITSPQAIGTETFTEISPANSHLCATSGTGVVRCTGGNYYGQYGNGTTDQDNATVWEDGATGVTADELDGASWDTHCALDTSGDVYCWGQISIGLTGTGEKDITTTPSVTTVMGATDVDGYAGTTCALTDANEVYCWGGWLDYYTGLAVAGRANPDPVLITSPPVGVTFQSIRVAEQHLCALTDQGEIYCIGANWAGQLGDGTGTDSYGAWVPAAHPNGTGWAQVTTGPWWTCALDASSAVYCWGRNNFGQLGTGTFDDAASPTQISGTGNAYTGVSASGEHTCATTTTSTVQCWGRNENGELGTGDYTNYNTPRNVNSGVNFRQVEAGNDHTCALTFTDEAYCWGSSDAGKIGDGNVASFPNSPTLVSGGFQYSDLSLGDYNFTCALELDGTAKCWGNNFQGLFGDGTRDFHDTPTDAWPGFTLSDFASVSGDTTCGIDTLGNVYCAGWHHFGATGVGKLAFELLPVRVGGGGN